MPGTLLTLENPEVEQTGKTLLLTTRETNYKQIKGEKKKKQIQKYQMITALQRIKIGW